MLLVSCQLNSAVRVRIELLGGFRVGAFHGAKGRKRIQIERLAGLDVDRAADAAFLNVRLRGLLHLDLADEIGREHEVVEAAGGVLLVENEPVGAGERVAVESRVGQGSERAAQVDALAFAEVALGHDTRDALQGFRQVLVGEFADILGGNDFLDADCLALGFQRLAHAGAVAVNHNLFDRIIAVVRRSQRPAPRRVQLRCAQTAPWRPLFPPR